MRALALAAVLAVLPGAVGRAEEPGRGGVADGRSALPLRARMVARVAAAAPGAVGRPVLSHHRGAAAPGPAVASLAIAGAPGRGGPAHRGGRRGAASRPAPRFGPWRWVTLGGGAAALGAGVVLVALDGSGAVADGRQQPRVRATIVPGLVSAAFGVGLVTTGLWMWHSDREAGRGTGLVVSLEPHGVALGVRGALW